MVEQLTVAVSCVMALGKLPRHLYGLVNRHGSFALSGLCRYSANSWQLLKPQSLSDVAGSLPESGPLPDPIPDVDRFEPPQEPSTVPLVESIPGILPQNQSSGDISPAVPSVHSHPDGPSKSYASRRDPIPIPDESLDPSAAFIRIRRGGSLAGIVVNALNRLQEGRHTVFYATGQDSINTAVKSIILVRRRFLEQNENQDIGFKAVHQLGANEERITRFMLTFQKVDFKVSGEVPKEQAVKVDTRTDGLVLGAKIVARTQDGGEIAVHAMGPRPVANTVVGLTSARKQLMGAGFDCLCFPQFIKSVLKGKGEVTLVQFRIQRVPFEADKDFKKVWYPVQVAASAPASTPQPASESAAAS